MNTELLKPRYKIIAPWPNMPASLLVGKILTLDKFGSGKWWHEWTDDEPIHIDEGCKKYSANLKLLEWWEERAVEEMDSVKYVKDIGDVEIFNCECTYTGMVYIKSNKGNGDMRYTSLKHFLPATIEEYNAYTGGKQ